MGEKEEESCREVKVKKYRHHCAAFSLCVFAFTLVICVRKPICLCSFYAFSLVVYNRKVVCILLLTLDTCDRNSTCACSSYAHTMVTRGVNSTGMFSCYVYTLATCDGNGTCAFSYYVHLGDE